MGFLLIDSRHLGKAFAVATVILFGGARKNSLVKMDLEYDIMAEQSAKQKLEKSTVTIIWIHQTYGGLKLLRKEERKSWIELLKGLEFNL
ncbi:hypothetical protein CUMW_245840 [Citrus unshiu]|uniref:Uncharacterized protein n=1 Tax=Citrus unshiu TaxID=55188 RepID=A0A2H5QP85_CITUN|nr:hypothetical protein CUMW_245840 [Citrus unshiu]